MTAKQREDNNSSNARGETNFIGTMEILQELVPRLIQETFQEIRSQSPPFNSQGPQNREERLKNYGKIVGRFDGSMDGFDFLDTMEAQFITDDISLENFTRAACSCLSGSAARWLLNDPSIRTLEWPDFRRKFKIQFCASSIGRTDLRKLLELRKEGSMEAHVNKCKALRRGISRSIPEEELIGIFLNTLPNKDQAFVAAGDPKSLDEAFEKALKYASYADKIMETSAYHTSIQNDSNGPSHIRDERKCFECGRRGHIQKNCYWNQKRETYSDNQYKWNRNNDKNRYQTQWKDHNGYREREDRKKYHQMLYPKRP